MFTRIARYCLQNWELVFLAISICVAVLLRTNEHTLAEHWVLGSAALLIVIPWSIRSWKQLQAGMFGIDLLTPLLIIFAVFLHHYWLAAAGALLLVLLQASHRFLVSSTAIVSNNKLLLAHVLRGRKTIDTAIEAVQPGDKLVVLPGETSPVDAVIVEGSSSFDESFITGGAADTQKGIEAFVFAGSVNITQPVTVRAIATNKDSYQTNVLKLANSTKNQQAPFSRVADIFSLSFTLLVLAIGAGAWYVHDDSRSLLSVLAVATTYPLTTVVAVGIRRGLDRIHRLGIYTRSSAVFESLASLQTIAFDASGTLTDGNMRVDAITAFKPYTETDLLSLAAPLLQDSSSALATCLRSTAESRSIKVSRVKHIRTLPGNGVAGTVKGLAIQVGPFKSLVGIQVATPKITTKHSGAVLYVAVNDTIAGYFVFSDAVRPDSKIAIDQFQKLGVRPMLLTEHTNAYAKIIATAVGVDTYQAEQTITEKINTMDDPTLRPIAYIGNPDSEATILTAADIGIATGVQSLNRNHGAASVFTTKQGIGIVAAAIGFAQRTLSTAKVTILIGQILSLLAMLGFAYYEVRPIYGLPLQMLIIAITIGYTLRPYPNKAS